MVRFGRKFVENKDRYTPEALKCLYENFIEPLRRGVPTSDLPGKYKPSWEVPDFGTTMQNAFRDHSWKQNLHHYHVGFRFYRPGRDPGYPGHESDGIVHTRIVLDEAGYEEAHLILRLDEEHPSPFTIPLDVAE